MKYVSIFCIFCTFSYLGISQTLPVLRAVNWNFAGLQGKYSEPQQVINFPNTGNSSGGTPSNGEIFNNLLSSLGQVPTVIYFPQGNYYFDSPLHLKSNIILRGASADSTVLTFDLSGEEHLISIKGSATDETSMLINDALKDGTWIRVEKPALFSPQDPIRLVDNDSLLVTSSWAKHSTGQINQIVSISGDTLFLSSPLRRNFSTNQKAFIVRLNLIQNVGIENLKIERLDKTIAQTSNIFFEYAGNCKVQCVESAFCNFAHVELRNSTNVEVSNNYFHDAFDYGGGGKAYGIMLHFSTGECLVAENTFTHLRHAMILQAGANGNVISYNYSTTPFWTETSLPDDAAGDLVLHGNYPYCNLLEGNTVQNIVIDGSHGVNGPFNTFFRNRAEHYGIFMSLADPTNDQNFLGNEITNGPFPLGNYFLNGTGHFEYGNQKASVIIPAGTGDLPEASLYLDLPPDYYQGNASWPPIGPPNLLQSHKIENEYLFNQNVFIKCNSPETIVSQISPIRLPVIIFPNPAREFLNIQVDHQTVTKIERIVITDTRGRELLENHFAGRMDIRSLKPGMYFVRIEFSDQSVSVKKVVKI